MHQFVSTVSLENWVDPKDAWRALCHGAEAAFWLDSGPDATNGKSYLGVGSELKTDFESPVLDWLRHRQFDAVFDDEVAPGFRLGWVGWLGYELRSQTMGTLAPHQSRYPDAAWMFVDRCLVFDHESRVVSVLALGDAEKYREDVLIALAGLVPEQPAPATQSTTVSWAYRDDEYLEMIRSCQAAIRDGQAYQLCLTTEARVDASPDPFATYLALRELSPSHHGALLIARDVAVVSASPEQFLRVSEERVVTTKPIKGTRRRDPDANVDAALQQELLSSAKERAENLMIVDLMRNDLARISRNGSVIVTGLCVVESYPQVHQLVSTVRGELAAEATGIDAIEACFPAGSMTGAPKRSATLLLDAVESRARGIYSGVLGYISLDGSIDLAMVIRSIVIDGKGSTVGAGGGITALSVPEEELAEVKLKAAALLAVLGVRHPDIVR